MQSVRSFILNTWFTCVVFRCLGPHRFGTLPTEHRLLKPFFKQYCKYRIFGILERITKVVGKLLCDELKISSFNRPIAVGFVKSSG